MRAQARTSAPRRPLGTPRHRRDAIAAVIGAYDDRIVRAYSRVRFQILRQRFLEEVGQYLPAEGRVLDIGCGFGLFALYYQLTRPGLSIHGLDLNPRRIEMARRAADRLGVAQARFDVADARQPLVLPVVDAVYMLDLIHHVPRGAARDLVAAIAARLPRGARLIIKDIETAPAYKRWFTFALDKLMDWRTPVDYWSQAEVLDLLHEAGFEAYRHSMVDYLPYPHVIYVATRL
ncbi:MAG: class I SAM-dependent methyltransferase [Vicinamibacterales bacterium]